MPNFRDPNRRQIIAGAVGLLAAPALIGTARAATRGVSDTEIIIGMMTDLSGVTAVQGSNAANSIRMAFDEINEKGGIQGRKIRFIAEDMEYLVPKAVQAMNKLVNRDNIFLAISSGGTPQMDAVLPMMIEKQVPSVFPLGRPAPGHPPHAAGRQERRGIGTMEARRGQVGPDHLAGDVLSVLHGL